MNIQKYHLIPVNMSKIHLSIHTYLILKQKINLPTRKEIYWNYSQTWSLKGTISPGGRKPKRSEKELIPYAFGGALSVSSFRSCVSELHWTFAAPATNTILLSSGWHARRREFFCTLSFSWALGTPAILDLWPHDAHSARRSRRAPGTVFWRLWEPAPLWLVRGSAWWRWKVNFAFVPPPCSSLTMKIEPAFILLGLTKR